MNSTLEVIKIRITEAEEWTEYKTEWWKSLPQNRIKKKKHRKTYNNYC